MMEIIQIVLLYLTILVLIAQFPAAECWIHRKKRHVKKSSNVDTSMEPYYQSPIHGQPHVTNTKQHSTRRSLENVATIKRIEVTPVKMFAINTNAINLRQGQASNFVPSESHMPTNRRYVSRKSITRNANMNSKQRSLVKRSLNQAPSSHHSVVSRSRRRNRRVRYRSRRRRRRRSTPTTITRRKRSSPTSSTSTVLHPTTDTTQNGSDVVVQNKFHPCNTEANSSAMEFRVKNIECRRWRKTDLQQMMNCLGTFNHQYLATTLQEALNNFTDLDTGGKLNLSKSFVLDRSESGRIRAKRGLQINPGETLIGQCYASKSQTESGHLRMCPICTAITRQPSQPRRFPEYINELVCDPKAKSNYLPGIDGFCVQKTFTLDLLQFEGDWEKNSALSAEAGHDVYTEKWESYTQTIKRHCACELLPSSPIASFL